EERELFEALRGASLDLVVLGEALAERRETLMEVMGLHRDDELGAQPESGRGQVTEARPRTRWPTALHAAPRAGDRDECQKGRPTQIPRGAPSTSSWRWALGTEHARPLSCYGDRSYFRF